MRWAMIVMILTVLVVVYGGSNFVVISRIIQSLPPRPALRWTVGIVLTLCAVAYIAARFLERIVPCSTACPLIWVGSVWFAILAYAFLVIAAGDLAFGLAGKLMGNPPFVDVAKDWIPRVALGVAILLSLYGAWNAMRPAVTTYDIHIDKPGPEQGLRIVALTDLHMGHIMGRDRIHRIVDAVNQLKPDLVLLGGDVVDEDIRPVMEQDLGKLLTGVHAPHGMYAVTGNHEFIGGVEPAVNYLESEGIIFLRDRAAKVAEAIWLVGREDRAGRRMGGGIRKDLPVILKESGVEMELPVILMDHQPMDLDEAVIAGMDLQISGHTHNGQLWPFNFITGAIFELDWGMMQKGDTKIVVSCGAGTWGPPVKVGSVSEIVLLNLSFGGDGSSGR